MFGQLRSVSWIAFSLSLEEKKKFRRDFSLAVTAEAFSVLIPLLRTEQVNRTNILDYSPYCYSGIWSVNRTSPKYVLCSRLKKSFESGEQFLLFWALLIPNFRCLIHVECCVDLWCYNSIITLITRIFALSQLLAQWFECFKIIFWEFVDLYIVMNYLKLERIRREGERKERKKKKWWQTKKICKSRMRSRGRNCQWRSNLLKVVSCDIKIRHQAYKQMF